MNAHKPFRIESGASPVRASARRPATVAGHVDGEQLLAALNELRVLVDPSQRFAAGIIEAHRRELMRIQDMRGDLDAMREAIEGTKREIAALRSGTEAGASMRRVAGELDAVISDTEQATNNVISAAEEIESAASSLRERLEADDAICADRIIHKTAALYEACNFQDLTGQRLSKIIRTLGIVEDRIDRMIGLWGADDLEISSEAILASDKPVDEEEALLNGPCLPTDVGHVSQDDIDSLFD